MSPLASLYRACGWLAGLFMIALLACILLGIIGRAVGFYVSGLDAYAGYCMAAAAFLALAHTFAHGDHIRVTLVIGRLGRAPRRRAELLSVAIAILASGALAFYSVKMVWWSWTFHDISSASDATPLWIPQLGMAIGTAMFCIAFVEELVLLLRGKEIRDATDEIAHTE